MTMTSDTAEAPVPVAAGRLPSTRLALAGLSLSVLLSSLGTSSANVALPSLASAFDAPFQQVQWIVLAYLLAITTLVVGMGRLGDIFGRRRLLAAGIAAFSAASVLCALAPSLWLLVAARAAQGLGAAAMMALAMAMVGGAVPKERTGRAMGLLATVSAAGTALGPSLGGALIAWAGWPAIFVVNVPLGLLAFALVRWHLPADTRIPAAERPAFDFKGALLLASTLGAFALALTVGRGDFGSFNAVLLAGAAVGLALFVRVETKAASPLVNMAMFAEPALGAGLASSGLVMTVMMTTLVVGPFYLVRALGLDADFAGLVMAVGPVVAALAGVPAGRLVDRFGARHIVVTGLAGVAAGAVLLSEIPAMFGVAGYVAALVVATSGYALFQTANNTAVMGGVAPDRRGVVSGLLNLSRNVGLVTGASAMGAVFAFASGAADVATADPEAVAAGMRMTFEVAAALAAAALAIVLAV
jgi:MFS family permease